MTTIENSTGVPHFWFEQTGPDGEQLDVLVVRATFAFGVDGQPMTLSPNQQPIAFGDAYSDSAESDPLRAVITEDGDLLPYKPGTDVLIVGHAVAPAGITQPSWLASVGIGQMRKSLRLHGPRNFYKSFFGWRLGPSEPVAYVPLDYRLAYGGCIEVPAALTADGIADTIKHSGNPAGCGWLPKPSAYKHLPRSARRHVEDLIKGKKVLPAPQIESAEAPVRHPFQNVAAQGLSPIARWCEPRLSWQGTYDDEWHATRNSVLPIDFDSRYYQSAAADQVCYPHLNGDERVVLTGLLSDDREMRLPGWRMVAVVTRASGESTVSVLNLDTVRFDLESGEASLVWRAHFDFDDPVVEIALAATTDGVNSDSSSMTTMPSGESTR
ncbi:DUF2169 family type VI secretion system accessory protein [Massilia soli]|uniref:DUF2169 domain-containing protein n=1 Tax=Massilia soli TaxID=2792854 RepID=A0ABS7SVZ1_9BURK|nr:DUF2169 domain-containing protein [Massilia soli]MBZ2210092.1 DUF2169 domain-containing protein [Massilia soli]